MSEDDFVIVLDEIIETVSVNSDEYQDKLTGFTIIRFTDESGKTNYSMRMAANVWDMKDLNGEMIPKQTIYIYPNPNLKKQ